MRCETRGQAAHAPVRAPSRRAIDFAANLADHGGRVAVIDRDGTEVSYRELADLSARVAGALGEERRLVLVAAANALDPLVAYLGALAGGHAVVLAPARSDDVEELIDVYDPDVVIAPDTSGHWRLHERRIGTRHALHPELALLLSTSGSTGSPKLVRLSHENVESNAEAIARYLGIEPTDRAVTTLPMHYCYGLSVLHTLLRQGGTIILSDNSVVDRCFWSTFRRHRATLLAGVPYTFELLDRCGFASMDLPTLRLVTQAGGRLAPDAVRRYARLGRRNGWDLFVMYGQTEATARMAYLPPHLALEHPATIGVAIPGGSFEIAGGGDEGELLYRGPNVMLGYATGPDDLAAGRRHRVLHTGDVARRTPDGLIEVVGRLSRFVKLFGLRVDLDEIERLLARHGYDAMCAGDDQCVVVAVPAGSRSDVIHELVRTRVGLPPNAVRVVQTAELPRLATGKPDHTAVRALAHDDTGADADLRDAFARILGCRAVPDNATFVTLGGDSLSYVEMSIEIERILGFLPEDWHRTAVADLERRASGRPKRAAMETNVVLRAVASVLIVGTHAGLFALQGGAHLFLAVAGFNYARFGVPSGSASELRRHVRSIARIAVPSVSWLVILFASPLEHFRLPKLFLLNNYAGTGLWEYWYIEVIVQMLVAFALVLALPAVRSIERRRPFAFALALFVGALTIRFGVFGTGLGRHPMYRTDTLLWLFLAGWVAQRAATSWHRLSLSVLVMLAVPGFFDKAARGWLVFAGVLLLVWCNRIPVHHRLVRPISVLAAASLWIYLTQFAVFEVLADAPPLARTAIAVAVGVGAWLTGRAAAAQWRRIRAAEAARVPARRRATVGPEGALVS